VSRLRRFLKNAGAETSTIKPAQPSKSNAKVLADYLEKHHPETSLAVKASETADLPFSDRSSG
jgi:hypothetical protein